MRSTLALTVHCKRFTQYEICVIRNILVAPNCDDEVCFAIELVTAARMSGSTGVSGAAGVKAGVVLLRPVTKEASAA
jgi:hypothetical protein